MPVCSVVDTVSGNEDEVQASSLLTCLPVCVVHFISVRIVRETDCLVDWRDIGLLHRGLNLPPLQKLSQEPEPVAAKAKAKSKTKAKKGDKKPPVTPMKRPSALKRGKSHAGLVSTPPAAAAEGSASQDNAESEPEAKPKKRPAAANADKGAEPASKKRPAAASKVEGQSRYSLDLFGLVWVNP